MYLRVLKRKEKEALVELAHYVSSVDNDFAASEKSVISYIRKALYLSETDYAVKNLDFDTILEILSESTSIAKLTIFLEIVSLVMIDQECHPKEMDVIETLRKTWNISDEIYHQVEDWIGDLTAKLEKTAEFLEKGETFINE